MFPTVWDDPHARKWNLWGYIDQRDVALSCRLALEAEAGTITGSPAFITASADTVTVLYWHRSSSGGGNDESHLPGQRDDQRT